MWAHADDVYPLTLVHQLDDVGLWPAVLREPDLVRSSITPGFAQHLREQKD